MPIPSIQVNDGHLVYHVVKIDNDGYCLGPLVVYPMIEVVYRVNRGNYECFLMTIAMLWLYHNQNTISTKPLKNEMTIQQRILQ